MKCGSVLTLLSKRRDAEVLELMEKHEAVVQRKEQELTYEREYRSQLQDEKIQIENQMAQMRAEVLRTCQPCGWFMLVARMQLHTDPEPRRRVMPAFVSCLRCKRKAFRPRPRSSRPSRCSRPSWRGSRSDSKTT